MLRLIIDKALSVKLKYYKLFLLRDHMYDVVEREYIAEKKAAAKEFEEKKVELRENLLNDFEDKRKMIESERHSMELNGDSMEVLSSIYILEIISSYGSLNLYSL